MATTYRVMWEIDVEADSPVDAARRALEIQRDPDSIATVFDVAVGGGTERIDLSDDVDHDVGTVNGDVSHAERMAMKGPGEH